MSKLNFSRPTTLAFCPLASLLWKTLVDGRSLQDVSSGCMAADSVSVQAVYGPAGPVLSGFTEQREGTAAATNAEPPHHHHHHHETTALLHKQGPCCVCERAPDTQPLMERIRLGCTTLIHSSRQHSIDASLSTHKGLQGTKTCSLKSLQSQTKAALKPWPNIYLQTQFLGLVFSNA